MMEPNWFDAKYKRKLQRGSAREALGVIASDRRILQAVKEALDLHDEHAGESGWGGPSRTQAVRTAIAETLQSMD